MPFVETSRTVVTPADCDVLGHMNVARYFGICGDGVFSFQTMLGLGISDIRDGRKQSFAVVRAESDFKSEVVAGEVLYLQTAVERIGEKSITFRHRLFRAETGSIVFETGFQCVLLDLQSRRAAKLPDDVRQKAEAYLLPPDDL